MKADPPAPDGTCDRCGGIMELVTHIPRRIGRPPLRHLYLPRLR